MGFIINNQNGIDNSVDFKQENSFKTKSINSFISKTLTMKNIIPKHKNRKLNKNIKPEAQLLKKNELKIDKIIVI